MIPLACPKCGWTDEREPAAVPLRCPDCQSLAVSRRGEPQTPETTRTDEL